MKYVLKHEFISIELESEIAAAIRERRSVEQLLIEKGFVGSDGALEELLHVLVKYMGAGMAMEFVFTANKGDWENYRISLNKLWDKITLYENFNTRAKLVLGQFLYQRGEKELGTKYMRKASANAADVKTAIAVAEVVNHEVGNKAWVKEILLDAREIAKTADDYAKIAKRFIEFLDDREESKKAIEKAVKMSKTFTEFCGAAVAIMKSFGDREWAEAVYAAGVSRKSTSSMLDALAEEEYRKALR